MQLTPPAPQLSIDSTQRAFLYEEFLKLGAHQNLRVLAGVMSAAAVLAWIAGSKGSPVLWTLWFTAVGLAQLARLYVESETGNPERGPLRQRLRWRVAVAALSGTVLALCITAFPDLDVTDRAFFTLVLLGLVTGAVANSAGNMATVTAFGIPMLLPLVLLWSFGLDPSGPSWRGPAFGALLVFYAVLLYEFARSAWKTFEESCLIRFREVKLNAQLKMALASAESANHAKTRFLAAASHDLRQPLHTIVLLSSALSLRPLDERSREIVRLLNEVTAALSGQLDDLLDISKLDAGVVDVNMQTVSVTDLVSQHFAEVEPIIVAKGLRADLRSLSQSSVVVDPVLLERILRNLTHNAVKFTERGHVALEVRDVGSDVMIAVEDSGRGIAPRHQDEIFIEFFQIGNSERDRSKGLGLGLSIVRRLADLLGIGIELRSEPGHGTRFELRLPRLALPVPALGRSVDTGPAIGKFNLHVLIVDDEQAVRASMKILLEELGCSCSEAASSTAAREQATVRRPDLVLADFRLKEGDSGLQALQAVESVCGPLPALLVSGDTAPERLREARSAGRRLIHKPVAFEDLKQELGAAQAAMLN